MSRFAILFAVFTLSFSAGAELNLPSGDYNKDEQKMYQSGGPAAGELTRLKIIRRGTTIRVVDRKHDIVYVLDLSKTTEEQPFHPKFIEVQKQQRKTGPIAKILENVTVSNIRNTANGIIVDVNVYLNMKSVFGTLRAKAVFETDVRTRVEKIQYYTGGTYSEKDTPIVEAFVGRDAHLASFTTNLGDQWDRPLGLLLDLVTRLIPTSKFELFQVQQ